MKRHQHVQEGNDEQQTVRQNEPELPVDSTWGPSRRHHCRLKRFI